eukprot:256794_1
MNLSQIFALHKIVNRKKETSIKAFIVSQDAATIKQLLSIYLKYFFVESNRVKHLQNNEISPIHNILLNNIKNNFSSTKKTKQNPLIVKKLQHLPELLLSYVISFLDHNERLKYSRISRSFFSSSKQPIAQSHIRITQKFFDKRLFPGKPQFGCQYNLSLNKYSSIYFSSMYNTRSEKQKKRIIKYFLGEAKNISRLKHVSLDYVSSPETITEFLKHLDDNQLSSFKLAYSSWRHGHFENDTFKNLLTNVKTLQVNALPCITHLFINKNGINTNENNEFQFPNGDADMKKYIIDNSVLEHLYLLDYYRRSRPTDNKKISDPIYWLWNIPTLKSVNLSFSFDAKEFKTQCKKLLLSSIMRDKAKLQTNFTEMNIKIRFNFKYISNLDVFFHYIKRIYPHLNTIIIRMDGNMRHKDRQLNLNQDHQLKWSKYFKNFIHLEIQDLNSNSAVMLLLECVSLYQLEVLKLKEIEGVNQNTVNKLSDAICNFLLKRPKNLFSFVIFAARKCMTCDDLIASYWLPYLKLFKCLMQMISPKEADGINIGQIISMNEDITKATHIVRKYGDNNNNNKYKSLMINVESKDKTQYNKEIYDGYLKVDLPRCCKIYKG